MAVMVQKYGGSSLADARAIRRCAARAVREHDAGHQVVVVVSAMGTTTDGLLALAGQLTDRPGPQAMDLLLTTGEQISTSLMMMAVQSLGVDAVGLAAGDIGISTVGRHGEARVRDVDAARIRRHLAARRIVVVAGFQGRNEDGRATTLGRGGSDITAVALAAALDIGAGGGCCEICSDVDGVYTADPRLVPEARKLDYISHRHMIELAARGAAVTHARAVSLGRRHRVPIHIRHAGREDTGTFIVDDDDAAVEGKRIVGCAYTPAMARLTITNLPDDCAAAGRILDHMRAREVKIHDAQQTKLGCSVCVSLTIDHADRMTARNAAREAVEAGAAGERFGARAGPACGVEINISSDLARISIVGCLAEAHTAVSSLVLRALGSLEIAAECITSDGSVITCFVSQDAGLRSLRSIHEVLGLSQTEPARETAGASAT